MSYHAAEPTAAGSHLLASATGRLDPNVYRVHRNFAPQFLTLLGPEESILRSHEMEWKGPRGVFFYGLILLILGILSAAGQADAAVTIGWCVVGAISMACGLYAWIAGTRRQIFIVTTHRIFYLYITYYPGMDIKKWQEKSWRIGELTFVGIRERIWYSIILLVLPLIALVFASVAAVMGSGVAVIILITALMMLLFWVITVHRATKREYELKLKFKHTDDWWSQHVLLPLKEAAQMSDLIQYLRHSIDARASCGTASN